MKAVLLFIENHQIDSMHRFLKPAVDGELTRAATPFHHRTSSDDGAGPALAGAAFGRWTELLLIISLGQSCAVFSAQLVACAVRFGRASSQHVSLLGVVRTARPAGELGPSPVTAVPQAKMLFPHRPSGCSTFGTRFF